MRTVKKLDKDKNKHYKKLVKDFNYEAMENHKSSYKVMVDFKRKPYCGNYGKGECESDTIREVQNESD